MPITSERTDLKQWAREHMVGVENCTFPSFTPDLADLDEEAIRHDVRQAIAHGFFSTMCSTETGLSFEEAKRFVEIVADEGNGRISVSTAILFDSMQQNRDFLVHAEAVGCDTALLSYAPSYLPHVRGADRASHPGDVRADRSRDRALSQPALQLRPVPPQRFQPQAHRAARGHRQCRRDQGGRAWPRGRVR